MIRKEVNLEQFYTPQSTANWVVDVLRQQPWWIDIVEVIEPTAGTGVFVNALKPFEHYMTVHAGDLEPKHPDVLQWDALTVDVEKILWNERKGKSTPYEHVLLIGNPPFGRRSKLAGAIWDHYAGRVGYSAFIVPRSMAIPKTYAQCRTVPKEHDVLFTLTLPSQKFDLPTGVSRPVKGCALVVTRHKGLRFE